MKIILIVLFFIISLSFVNVFAQEKKINKHFYTTLYKGWNYSTKTEIFGKSDKYSSTSSNFTATGIGLGYSFNPRWSLEVQYQYIADFKARVAAGGNYNLPKAYNIDNADNEVKIEISHTSALIKWNYFLYDFSFGRVSMNLGFGYSYRYINVNIDDGGKKNNFEIYTTIPALSPIAFAYQRNNLIFSYSYYFWTADAYSTSLLGVSYYFL